MDLPRLEAMNRYWLKHPPVHLSMAAYVGWGQSKQTSDDQGDLDALMASTPTMEKVGPDGR